MDNKKENNALDSGFAIREKLRSGGSANLTEVQILFNLYEMEQASKEAQQHKNKLTELIHNILNLSKDKEECSLSIYGLLEITRYHYLDVVCDILEELEELEEFENE